MKDPIPVVISISKEDYSEEQIVERARAECRHEEQSKFNFGEWASIWTVRHANGRTDEDFGKLVGGMSQQSVNYRRLVWERFGTNRRKWPSLSWTHFKTALAFGEDAETGLDLAEKEGLSLREMIAQYSGEQFTPRGVNSDPKPTEEEGLSVNRMIAQYSGEQFTPRGVNSDPKPTEEDIFGTEDDDEDEEDEASPTEEAKIRLQGISDTIARSRVNLDVVGNLVGRYPTFEKIQSDLNATCGEIERWGRSL